MPIKLVATIAAMIVLSACGGYFDPPPGRDPCEAATEALAVLAAEYVERPQSWSRRLNFRAGLEMHAFACKEIEQVSPR